MRHLSLLAVGVLAACHKGPDLPAATRTDSAGIEIVLNSGVDRAVEGLAVQVDTILQATTDTALQGAATALEVDADGQGRLFFADGSGPDRRVFRRDVDGLTRQLGGPGGGPGEYEIVGPVAVSRGGETLVTDHAKLAFVQYASDGTPHPNLPWSVFGRGQVRGVELRDSGLTLVLQERSESTWTQTMYMGHGADTQAIARVEIPVSATGAYQSCPIGIHFPDPPVFAPGLRWDGNGETTVLADRDLYRIDVWHGNRLVRSIRRDAVPRPATKALAELELAPGMRFQIANRPCTIPPEEILEKRGFASTIPAIRQLAIANDGMLWVERFTVKGEPVLRDLFDASGEYVGTMTGDTPWPQAWLPDGRYVGIEADGDSLPVIIRVRVNRLAGSR